MARPVVLLHGFGGRPEGYRAWISSLRAAGRPVVLPLHYDVRSNDVDLDDLAEALDRTLRRDARLAGGAPFDAFVHSTGLLVLAAWLAREPTRAARLRWVVGLAPATFGSPLAHLGRGMLAGVFRGDWRPGPDFLEGGDRVLRALELASPTAWRLADAWSPPAGGAPPGSGPHLLLVGGAGSRTGPAGLVHPAGSDGVVRVAGLDPRAPAYRLDARPGAGEGGALVREGGRRPAAHDLPPLVLPDADHGSVLRDPPPDVAGFVLAALAAPGPTAALRARATARAAAARGRLRAQGDDGDRWRQAWVRVEDERGDGVRDYYVDLLTRRPGARVWRRVATDGALDVHVHGADPASRAFHVRPPEDADDVAWALRLVARSGSPRVGYVGRRRALPVAGEGPGADPWTAVLPLTPPDGTAFLPVGTTVRLRVVVERQPWPPEGPTHLVRLAG
ncbi:MAG: hypothetical protein RI554_01440 [Trueperaceae bacterium]|nr:hypothetical protein [Trueperaceae bacterium]